MPPRRPNSPPAWLLAGVTVALASVAFGAWRMLGGGPTACAAIADRHEADNCYSAQLIARRPVQLTEVVADAEAIDDPLIRAASVLAWAEANRGQLLPDTASKVCHFAGESAGKCRQQVQAGHLRRP